MLLGKLLLQLRLVTPVQLDAALRAQVAHGGRLGTNLLRLGYIEPDSLTAALAKQLEVRGVSLQRLSRLDELTLKRVPAAVARRNRSLPLGLIEEAGRRNLCAAFVDPHDLACVDEVAFACGLPVIPFVAPELYMQKFLEQYYSVESEEQMAQPQPAAQPAAAPDQRGAAAGGGRSSNGGRVLELRPNDVPQQRAAQQTQSEGQFWNEQGDGQPVMRGRSATQGFRAMSQPEARSLEQALRVAGDDEPANEPVPEPHWDERGPRHHPGGRREVPYEPPRRRQTEPPRSRRTAPPRPPPEPRAQEPLRYGAPNPAEEAKRPPFRIKSELELDAPRHFAEDDFDLPTQQPRVRELDEDALSQAVLGSPRMPERPSRQRSEEIDLTGIDHRNGRREGARGAATAHPGPEPRAADAERSRPALSLDETLSRLEQARSREAIGDLVSDCLRSAFGCGLVFICRDDLCLGWKGFAPNVPSSVVESIVLPLGTPSLFRIAHQRGSIFRGAPPRDGELVQQRLWKLIQVNPPEEVVVAPVKLGRRVINLVYAHAFDRGSLPDSAVVEVSELVKGMQDAFTRLIKTAKQG